MKFELVKVEHPMFKEYYEGTGLMDKEVHCILDDNCVRYTVLVPSKKWASKKIQSRREYKNSNKDRCFQAATEALNQI